MFVLVNVRLAADFPASKPIRIRVRGGRIESIEPDVGPLPPGAEPLDGAGCLVLPGAIDAHVHFDTPGFTHREDFEHGTAGAAAGGVTTVVDMPCTSIPPVVDGASLRHKLGIITPRAHVDFALFAGVSANLLGETDWKDRMAEAVAAGAVGFKAYLLSGMDTFAALDEPQLEAVMTHAAALGRPVALHAEDPATVRERTAALRAAGRNDWAAVAEARADPTELLGVETGLRIAERTGCPLHVVHVGSAAAAARIGEARRRGVDVTAETCPHFLAFTRDDLSTLGPFLKTAPIVKTAADRDGLWAALADGTLDFVATDHAPCPRTEKDTADPWDAYGGVPGVETLLVFLWSEGVVAGRLTPKRLLQVTAAAPARRWGLGTRKGALAPGRDADLVLLDADASWTIRGEQLHTKAGWTPFEGRTFHGRVVRTFVRGRLVYDRDAGLPLEPGWGAFLPRAGVDFDPDRR